MAKVKTSDLIECRLRLSLCGCALSACCSHLPVKNFSGKFRGTEKDPSNLRMLWGVSYCPDLGRRHITESVDIMIGGIFENGNTEKSGGKSFIRVLVRKVVVNLVALAAYISLVAGAVTSKKYMRSWLKISWCLAGDRAVSLLVGHVSDVVWTIIQNLTGDGSFLDHSVIEWVITVLARMLLGWVAHWWVKRSRNISR